MLDFSHVLDTPGANVQVFYGNTTTTTLREWQMWTKPRGSRMLFMIGVGGGGSGGNSRTVSTSTACGGSGGGGSGGQTTLIIPSAFVPDTLYIQAGNGGVVPTPASGNPGVAGQPTYVSIEPNTTLTANNILLFANGGSAGGVGAPGGAGGAGGAGGTVATIGNMPLAGRGIYNFLGGMSGAAGSTSPSLPGNIGFPGDSGLNGGLMVTGGAGGGSRTAVGGTTQGGIISSNSGLYISANLSNWPITQAASGTTQGNGGIRLKNFLCNYGGSGGGGGSNSVGAGSGGDGAPGCGGGGPGASAVGTFPRPGFGGPGFVIIYSW